MGFIPLLFLLISCSGGGGGGSGGQSALSVELAFTPGNGSVTVELMEKGSLVGLLNISSYQLTATDSANTNRTMAGEKLDEETFNGSMLDGLMNDANYIFALRVFYFPVGSDQQSNLSLHIDYVRANAQNIRDAGGITIGSNRDGDYLADLADADDDNDGVNDLSNNGEVLDRCPRGELDWQSGDMTDNDGDGCRDLTEDDDDDNDGVGDTVDSCPLGELGWQSDHMTDNDGDGCRDATEDEDDDNDRVADSDEVAGCELLADCDNDMVADADEVTGCELLADCDNDGVRDSDELAGCERLVDCDSDSVQDGDELTGCRRLADCDSDGERDGVDIDDDGDGLIELSGAAGLNATRYQLDGSGRRLSAGGALNQTGCGNGGAVTECNGYELTQDISLAAYKEGVGWMPLGSCSGDEQTGFKAILDGNGFSIRDLNISRPTQNCVGLFARLENSAVIRNLVVVAEAIEGRDSVGVLAGLTNSTQEGNTTINGVSVKVDSVSGNFHVGGLVGGGGGTRVISSSVVAGSIDSESLATGGLAGNGDNMRIFSSFVLANRIGSSGADVGGLIGLDSLIGGSIIANSYAVVGLITSGGDRAEPAGLIGEVKGSNPIRIINSYAVSDLMGVSTNLREGLVGRISTTSLLTISASYWDRNVNGLTSGEGSPQTSTALRSPTDYAGIYDGWDDGYDYDVGRGNGLDDITIWCDSDRDGAISTAEQTNSNRIWDFGSSSDYPAIRCTLDTPAEQRSLWSINTTTDRPQLN